MYLSYIYIHTYVVGYSFITVVHILQHSITRYNIYNPTAREIRGKGRIFSWSILLIFFIQYCVRHRNTKIFPFFVLQTIIGRWKVRLSSLSFVRSLFQCIHNMAKKCLELNDSLCYQMLWWQIVMKAGFVVWKSQTYNKIHFKMSHEDHISHLFISIQF